MSSGRSQRTPSGWIAAHRARTDILILILILILVLILVLIPDSPSARKMP